MSHPTHIGRYEVMSLLSVGGMAEVYLARISGPGDFRKFVVLKRILQDLRDDERFVEMFKAEARITAGLSHSNIAQVFDFGEDADNLYLAMEFIQGVDLAKLIKLAIRRTERLPLGLTIRVIHDLCLALHYAHTYTDAFGERQPVFHRDVNPRNVMVSHSGTVKVIDFGIAKVEGTVPRTTEGTVRGSTGYLSPEQVQGQAIDGRSDQFNVGVLLHEMLVGAALFSGVDFNTSVTRLLLEPIRSPAELDPTIPTELSDLAMRALSLDPNERFATCHEMALALEQSGVKMYDEQRVGHWVREQFPQQLARTRSLLEAKGAEDARVMAGRLKAAVAEERAMTTPPMPHAAEKTVQTSPIVADASIGATLLAVDDSRVGQMMVQGTLNPEGFKVFTCGSAKEALEMLSEMQPDLIISDVQMPEMDGFEFCQAVRKRPALSNVPLVFLSSSCSVEERARGLEVGCDDFVRKPFNPADLITRVRGHIRRVALLKKIEGTL